MANEGKRGADGKLLLALACGATIELAARQAGVSESTVRRRLKEPAFQAKLNKLRAEMHLRVADQLTAASTEGVRTMVQLMKETNPGSVRLGAARSVVELSTKVRETADLAIRLAELERRLEEQDEGKRRGA
jgi:AraC-like DNA-binding protein